jgi:hypothetical protein
MHGLLNRWDNRRQGMLSLWQANRRLSSNPLWEVRKDKDSNCLSMPIPLVDEIGQGIEPSHPLDDRSLNYNRRGVLNDLDPFHAISRIPNQHVAWSK